MARSNKARKPVLSPTKFCTYLTCPLLYKFVYIDNLGRYYYRPKSFHSFGSSLHRALSDFHLAGGPETETADELTARLRERWVSIGYESAKEEMDRLETAAALLSEYHSSHIVPGEKTLLVERQLRWHMGEFILAGRVDRLVELADGTICVIDYKSGREKVSEEDVRRDLAMCIYQLLAARNYPDRRVAGTIYCLRSGARATASLSQSEFAELEGDIRALASEMLKIDRDTVIEPIRKAICDNCDFLSRCRYLVAKVLERDWD